MKKPDSRELPARRSARVLVAYDMVTWRDGLSEKPVLYLYPQEERQLTVTLDLEGSLTPCTRPRTTNARPIEGPRPRGR